MRTTQDTMAFELALDDLYTRSAKLAQRYYFNFRHPKVRMDGLPTILFLGNHSSGKSSMINWILGGARVQDTGVAPTDDGFTIIIYGENEEDVNGPAGLAKLPPEFQGIESFGSLFLQRLRVKTRNRECLKQFCLVDSPGMIDAAEGTVSRDYDFQGAVRRFSELCDMIYFLFDPDKPGTTSETVTVFANCLRGLEFKLRVLLNKCDAFQSTFDFARAYGTLCWNLARVLRTKDLPRIYTTYSGDARNGKVVCSDFDRQRRELLDILDNAAARRLDNVFAAAQFDFTGLSIRMRILNDVQSRVVRQMFFCITGSICAVLITACGTILGIDHSWAPTSSKGLACGLVFGMFVGFLGYLWTTFSFRRLRAKLAKNVDSLFADAYRAEISIGTHDDWQQCWSEIRAETSEVIAHVPFRFTFFGEWRRRRLDGIVAKTFRKATSS